MERLDLSFAAPTLDAFLQLDTPSATIEYLRGGFTRCVHWPLVADYRCLGC